MIREVAVAEDAEPRERPKIRDILSEEELRGIAQNAGMSLKELGDVLGPLGGMSSGVFQAAASAGSALGETLGWKSTNSAELALACSYPAAVRALIFAITSIGYRPSAAFDTPYGSCFEALLPGDIFAAGGAIRFDVRDRGERQIHITGTSEIKGQKFDWGKGKRALNAVFEKTKLFADRLRG